MKIPRARILLAMLGATLCLGLGAIAYATVPTSSNHVALRGQWFLDPDGDHGALRLSLRRRGPSHYESWGSESIALAQLGGLAESDLAPGAHPVVFAVRRDAGTFACRGEIDERTGAGTFELTLDPAFAADLERRGIGTPTEDQQIHLAIASTSYRLLDELAAQKYPVPRVTALVTMADHGVNLEFIRGLSDAGYRLGSLTDLIRARDHGVDATYLRSLQNAGYRDVPFDELLRARDHGVDASFLASYHALGYRSIALDALITLRDHGVDAEYLRGMRELGLDRESLDALRQARDHGVDAEFVSNLVDLGYKDLALREVVEARDHGVDAGYVAGMARVGFKGVPLENLVAAHDHGVDPAFARRMREKHGEATLSDIIAYRDRGGDR